MCEPHHVFTEKVGKIGCRVNDDKRLQTSDRVTVYPYGYEFKNRSDIIHINEKSNMTVKKDFPHCLYIPRHPYRILIALIARDSG